MLLLALADMPYGYYQFLRLVVTISALWLAIVSYDSSRQVQATALGLVAILYNPLFKISMDREVHEIVNVLTAVIYIGFALLNRNRFLVSSIHD